MGSRMLRSPSLKSFKPEYSQPSIYHKSQFCLFQRSNCLNNKLQPCQNNDDDLEVHHDQSLEICRLQTLQLLTGNTFLGSFARRLLCFQYMIFVMLYKITDELIRKYVINKGQID